MYEALVERLIDGQEAARAVRTLQRELRASESVQPEDEGSANGAIRREHARDRRRSSTTYEDARASKRPRMGEANGGIALSLAHDGVWTSNDMQVLDETDDESEEEEEVEVYDDEEEEEVEERYEGDDEESGGHVDDRYSWEVDEDEANAEWVEDDTAYGDDQWAPHC